MKRLKQLCMPAMAAALIVFGAAQGRADTTYDLAWSGAALGNTATATGTITLNLADINNPGGEDGFTSQDVTPFVTDFSITITGASSGDGTFGFSDFDGSGTEGGFYIYTGGGTLNFTEQLVGQPTPGGPFGSTNDGSTGDFNIFLNGSDPTAPQGTFFFQITTDGGTEDTLDLTSFAPASVVTPEPSELIPAFLLAVGFVVRRRNQFFSL